jgi:hypothetical protein
MNTVKIELCKQHYRQLAPHVKERETAKHFKALLDIAETQQRQLNEKEMELQKFRVLSDETSE